MNSLGTSIVNGIYRIVINQILQSPGIYYRSELDHNGISFYTGTIISDRGRRSKLEIDREAKIWARVGRKQKVSILVLSSAMGSSPREIIENTCYPEIFLSFLTAKKIGSKENVLLEFCQLFACVDSDDIFFDPEKFLKERCQLGRIGRRNMNRRLNLDIPENNTFLLPGDILAAVDHLIGMKLGMGTLTLDDMNHLQNKRIRSVADLLQDQFRFALGRLKHVVEGSICRLSGNLRATPRNLVTSTPLTTAYVYFFSLHPLSQVLDQTNPLTHIVHGRKLSYLGPGGLTARTASFRTRDIHPSYYGRICPIDTSEGINVGLIGSLAVHARIGRWDSLESPFFGISERSKGPRMLYLSPGRDEYYMVASGNTLALNQGIQEEQVVPARFCQEFLTIAWEQVHLRSIFSFQYFSIGASLIPFIEHNDANRALMSSNMQRQAVPLSRSEKCIVGTGLERQAALDSGALALAKHEGKIISIDTDKILLSSNGDILSIPLVMYERSNKNTCMHQKPQVQRGKCIKRGQILADGAATVGGELALGKNVLVAYMPWEGYNFEDAVLISERLVYEDIYTSFHIRKYEIQIYVTSQGPERVTNEIPHLEAHLLRNLDKNGIVMLGSWVEEGDILVGKLTPEMVTESSAPEDRLLQAILGIEVSTSKESCLKLPRGGRGRVIDVRWIQKSGGSSNNTEMIRVYISQKRQIKVGDKVAGRHGNKGIISKILPRQDMPYLQDGRPVDMVFNPLGVPSRMNVGQLFESSLGLAGGLLDRHYRIAPFDERYEQEASRKLVFSELYEAGKQTSNPWVFEPEYPGKSKIFDGRTGDAFEQPVLIGKPYILKLIHQVDDKIHGRSSGPYTLVTQQPVRGRAKQGGQRVGEMEVWALEGYGVAHILQEILTYKSDHIRARQEVLGTTLIGGTIPNPEDAPEGFRLLVRELRSLALELNHFLVSEKNFQINRKEA
nr:RNA polymerase beta subunit [Pseudocodon vinciflorus]